MKKSFKTMMKKDKDELMEYIQFKHRGHVVIAEKGKGSKYNRQKEKNKFLTNED